jgi:hypothetical protein
MCVYVGAGWYENGCESYNAVRQLECLAYVRSYRSYNVFI